MLSEGNMVVVLVGGGFIWGRGTGGHNIIVTGKGRHSRGHKFREFGFPYQAEGNGQVHHGLFIRNHALHR